MVGLSDANMEPGHVTVGRRAHMVNGSTDGIRPTNFVGETTNIINRAMDFATYGYVRRSRMQENDQQQEGEYGSAARRQMLNRSQHFAEGQAPKGERFPLAKPGEGRSVSMDDLPDDIPAFGSDENLAEGMRLRAQDRHDRLFGAARVATGQVSGVAGSVAGVAGRVAQSKAVPFIANMVAPGSGKVVRAAQKRRLTTRKPPGSV